MTLLGLGGAALILRRAARTEGGGRARADGSAWLSAGPGSSTTSAASRTSRRAASPPGGLPAWAAVPAFERPGAADADAAGCSRAAACSADVIELAPRFATEDELRARAQRRRTCGACSTPPRAASASRSATTPGRARARTTRCCSPPAGCSPPSRRCSTGSLDNAFALLRPPGHHAERDARDGLLPRQQRRDRGALGAARARARARGDRRLGRAPRQRDRGDLPRRPVGADDLAAPGRALPRAQRRARHARSGRGERQRAAAAGDRRRRLRARVRPCRRAGRARVRGPSCC